MSTVDGPGRGDGWQPPAPDHRQRLGLPAHLRPAAAALFDDLPEVLAGLVVEGAEARLDAGAADLVARLEPGREVIVDGFQVRRATSCPAAAVSDDEVPFAWTAATAARTVGLRAVAYHLRGDRAAHCRGEPQDRPVESAVEEVVADLVAGGGERSPGPWLAGLAPPARAVAVAQARRWAEQAVAWLPLRLVGDGELRFLQDDWWPPRSRAPAPTEDGRSGRSGHGGRALVVHGRRDITVAVAGRRVAVTVAGGTVLGPGLAEVGALTALAGVLWTRGGGWCGWCGSTRPRARWPGSTSPPPSWSGRSRWCWKPPPPWRSSSRTRSRGPCRAPAAPGAVAGTDARPGRVAGSA